jgi:hypothetical protein
VGSFKSECDIYFFRNDDYVQGCRDFLAACLSFGTLMNRLVKPERGHPFTPDGNSYGYHASSSYRMKKLDEYIKKKDLGNKAKKLRQIDTI